MCILSYLNLDYLNPSLPELTTKAQLYFIYNLQHGGLLI